MRVLFYNKMYRSFLWTILMFYMMYCFLIWPCDILPLQPSNFVNQLLSHSSKGFQSELVCCLCLVTKSKQDQEVCQTMTLPPDYWLCMINKQMWTLGVIKAGQQIPGKDICWINSHQNLPFFYKLNANCSYPFKTASSSHSPAVKLVMNYEDVLPLLLSTCTK